MSDAFSFPARTPAAIGGAVSDDLSVTAARLRELAATSRDPSGGARSPSLPDHLLEEASREPFFAWVVVEEEGAGGAVVRRFRVGQRHVPELRIVSWRHPIAELLYQHEVGDPYARSAGGGSVEGEVRAQARLRGDVRSLSGVRWEDAAGLLELRRDADGRWVDPYEVSHRVVQKETERLQNILSVLTREQYQLLATAADRPLVIRGKAGSGKTTVGLYRLSFLAHPRSELIQATIQARRTLVVMFNLALMSYVQSTLEELDLREVRIKTFHGWAMEALGRAFKGEIKVDKGPDEGRDRAVRLKAHRGMADAVARYVQDQTARMENWLLEQLGKVGSEWLDLYTEGRGAVLARLVSAREAASAARRDPDPARARRATLALEIYRRAVERMRMFREDLLALLSDADLLSRCLPGVSRAELDGLADWQRALQRNPVTRKVGSTVAFADLAILLRILQIKLGGLPKDGLEGLDEPLDHLLVDEVQDFGAVELMVLLDAVKSRSGVTLVGDLNQKILPNVEFMGWDALAREVGLGGAKVAELAVGHRSTAPIMALCDRLLGDPPSPGRPGPSPRLHRAPDPESAMDLALQLALARRKEAPASHVCVVCPGARRATAAHASLQARAGEEPIRFGRGQDFEFSPGVTVTNVQQIKGLEFDTVILLGAGPEDYPATVEKRSALYVSASRAAERLEVVAVGPLSPLLEDVLEAGLLVDVSEEVTLDLGVEDEPF